jgi:hypothetical protein
VAGEQRTAHFQAGFAHMKTRYGGGVVDTYLTLLGAALAGLVVLVTVFVATTARTPTRGWSRSTVLATASGSVIIILGLGTMGLAAALLTPVLVVAVAVLLLAAMGYTGWRLWRLLAHSGDS